MIRIIMYVSYTVDVLTSVYAFDSVIIKAWNTGLKIVQPQAYQNGLKAQ